MKKRILSVLLAAAMLSTLLAGCERKPEASADSTAAADGDVVRIGVFEPASGDNGAGGKQETLGIQYANYVTPTVEIGGKEYTVQLDIVDNESSNDKAPTAAATLVSNGVSVVLGSYGSGVSIAGSDTFKEAGIPVIGVTCTNPQITEGNTHYFRICFLDPFQGTVLANYAFNELGATTAYCLAELGNDYDQGLAHYFQEAFQALGGTVIAESFPTGTADFTSYLSNATIAGAQVFFAPCSLAYTSLIVDQAAAQGVTYALLGSDTWDSNVITNAAAGKNVTIYITTFYQEGGSPEFDAGIKEWMNANPEALTNNGGNDMVSAVTVMGYDAYFVALQALELAGSTDPAAVNEALWNVDYTGVSGEITFNEIGDANRDSAYIKTANTADNVWEFVTVQTVE